MRLRVKQIKILSILVVLLPVAIAFQNCSSKGPAGAPLGLTQKATGEGNKSSLASEQDSGMPFDGKLVRTFQTQDPDYCSKINALSTGLRNEVIHDGTGYWTSVENCASVPARKIDSEIQEETATGIKLARLTIPKVDIVDKDVYRRIECVVGGTDHVAVIVFESENGLKMHYPRKFEVPNFIPVSATHEFTRFVVPTPTFDRVFTSSYKAAYWNESSSGQFSLWLNNENDPDGVTPGRWLLQLSTGETFLKNGECRLHKPNYSW